MKTLKQFISEQTGKFGVVSSEHGDERDSYSVEAPTIHRVGLSEKAAHSLASKVHKAAVKEHGGKSYKYRKGDLHVVDGEGNVVHSTHVVTHN